MRSCSSTTRPRSPDLESRRHLQPRGAARAERQLRQAAAFAQCRILVAQGPGVARGGVARRWRGLRSISSRRRARTTRSIAPSRCSTTATRISNRSKRTRRICRLEWYFADKSVLSGAVFWKDIDGFITTELAGEHRHRRRRQHRRRARCADPLRREPPDQRRQGQGAGAWSSACSTSSTTASASAPTTP